MTAGAGAAARYARILRSPHVARTVLAVTLARLPIGIDGLALVLFVRERTGSYASAGAVAAAFSLGVAASAPPLARLIDRRGQAPVIVPAALIHTVTLVALVALGAAGAGLMVLVILALVSGAALPPVGSVMRTLWPDLMRHEPGLLSAAFALDAVLVELVFVGGPLIVAAMLALLGPAAALLAAVAASLSGTLLVATSPPSRRWRPQKREHDGGFLGPLRARGMGTLVAAALPFGCCFGAIEVALPAFAEDRGARGLAGVLLATWSLASATGGLVYGARQTASRHSVREIYVFVALIIPLGYLPLALAPSLPVMALLLVPAGATIAPLLTSGTLLVGELAPAGALTEAYTWPITALVVGVSAGNAVAGWLADHVGWEASCLSAAGAAAVGAALVLGLRRTLAPLSAATS